MHITHLEMVNIWVAMQIIHTQWKESKVLIKCDNRAVVDVLSSGKTRDPFLAMVARNIWALTAKHDIVPQYVHVPGADNKAADLFSRWTGSQRDFHDL